MKKMILTFVVTTILAIMMAYVFDNIVWRHFGWDYPVWVGYAALAIVAYAGGRIGAWLDGAISIVKYFRRTERKYIVKEL